MQPTNLEHKNDNASFFGWWGSCSGQWTKTGFPSSLVKTFRWGKMGVNMCKYICKTINSWLDVDLCTYCEGKRTINVEWMTFPVSSTWSCHKSWHFIILWTWLSMALRCHRDFPIGRLVDQSSVPFIQTRKDPCVSRPWELSPNSFRGWEGWERVAWRLKQGETMEFSCEN